MYFKSCLVHVQSEKYPSWVTLTPQLDRCCQGEAEVRILKFKTTWSEFHMPSQTAPAEAGGEAELHILDFKTTWSEFQKPFQAAAMQGKPKLGIYNLKKHHLPRVVPKQLCASAYLGYFLLCNIYL